MLRLLEEKIPRCRPDPDIDEVDDDDSGLVITTMELSAALSTSINVATGIGKIGGGRSNMHEPDRTPKKRKRKDDDSDLGDEDGEPLTTNGDIMEVDPSSDDDVDGSFPKRAGAKPAQAQKPIIQDRLLTAEDRQNRMTQVRNHLQLLAEDSRKFLTKCGTRGFGEWKVDFAALAKHLKSVELGNIISQRFEPLGARLVRILKDKGKLDEKQLTTIGLVKQKDVRTKLVELQMAGFVDIQEVPRDINRTPSRTIFLWWFDDERVTALVLDSIYKAMSRCLQVLAVEKQKMAETIALSERTDVQEGEASLTQSQMNLLADLRAKEQTLLCEIGRLDKLVGIFRDY